ncbi:hypothetical protein CPK_ORF00658 [Chlamydia pneumoniae LPCoLN]|nr:hypothetical protein CPK_ORF00658 [Chlamydia pneumoniae LPCoLN]
MRIHLKHFNPTKAWKARLTLIQIFHDICNMRLKNSSILI